MTISLEKVFFAYILSQKKYFEIVEPVFFKNTEIQFVYTILRKYMLTKQDLVVPGARQLWEMISLEDMNGLISKDILKQMLTVKLEDYDEQNFIIPKIHSWIVANRIKCGTTNIIDEAREVEENISNFESVIETANRIKSIVDDMSNVNFLNDNDDFGSDFDDPENHVQDNSRFKVKSGFTHLDHILGGGWDIQTLNVVMAETNNGKSLWMQNFAVLSADLGYNVLYITLEMSERKVMKRLGSMRLRIPINDYDTISKDSETIKKKIENLKKSSDHVEGRDLFETKVGKIYTKFWAAGTATVNDFDNYLQKLRDKKGVKIDLIIVDYITLIALEKGQKSDQLYSKGKFLAEGLRSIAAKYTAPVITGVQVAKDAWNSTDITLDQVPESKAIAETADTFFAIIRTEEMKRQNLYRFKLLKQRDGDFLKSQIRFTLNPTFLTLGDAQFIDAQ